MEADPSTLLPDTIDYDPAGDFFAAALAAPPKWAVCLLESADGAPVQLLSVKNLRYCLRRRLGEPEADEGPTRRIDYRQIVRRARWRRVDSEFEADLIYLEAARRLFPDTYRSMTGYRPAWFVHVNPDTAFPRFIKTADLNLSTGTYLGPLDSKGDAAKLIEQTQDLFDLCRFYSILVQAPDGPACAYKEMGKCPAPCDGSISMESYRQAVRWAAESVPNPAPLLADTTGRMRSAAAALNFEAAGRVKKYVEEIERLNDRKFRHVRPLEQFRWLSLQAGPREGTAKVFLITPQEVREVAGLLDEPAKASDLLRHVLDSAGEPSRQGVDAERVSAVSHHLFKPKSAGVYLRLEEVEERSLARAYRELMKQVRPPEEEAEGVVKELGAGREL